MNTDILAILQHLENKDAITLFFDWLQKMIQELDIKADDKRLRLTPRLDDLKISVNINHRTVLRIFRKEKVIYLRLLIKESDLEAVRSKFTLIAKDKSQEKFQTILVDIDHAQILNSPDATFLLEKWFNACKIHYNVSLNSTQTEKNNPELYEIAVNKELREKYLSVANTNQILLERYKNIIRETHLKQELYKWEKVQQFQGRPNTEAPDFQQELKNIQFENLIYQIAKSVMLSLAKEKEEEYRACMKKLFDETQPLENRVANFVSEADNLYNQISPLNTSHHDERTIATLLTYKYPEKYAFYKDSFYQKYCKLLNIPTEKKNKKYVHYLMLIQDLKENFLQKDAELLEMVKVFLPPNSYADTSLNILVQDILYQVLDRELDTNNYWVFQCNPKQFDIETALRENVLSEWSVTAHKDTIKIGDKIILWVTGEKSGCYALAESLDSAKARNPNAKDAYLWIDEQKEALAVAIKITHNWVETPIFKEKIKDIPDLADFKGGTQGTNLSSNKNEYLAFLNIFSSLTPSQNPTFITNMNNAIKHPLNQILYGPPGTGKTYNTINEALAIIEGKDAQSFENEDRTELTTRYKKYVEAGQIMFTTFHQSMSYEDFIEGIKPLEPVETDTFIKYKVVSGIFKQICEKANEKNIISNDNFNELYDVFLLQHKDKLIELKTTKHQLPFDLQVNEKGDCYAIARTEKASKAGFVKQDIQKYIVDNISHYEPSYFPPIAEYIKEYIKNNQQNYILIIDEINRGNVSQIFGELITLIEDSKRKGESEELEITLPYSKKSFSVPNNLYIIGTMNTADRSVEALDTALRRRFIFKEMPAKPELLSAPYLFWNLMWEYKNLKWEEEPYSSKEKEFFDFFGASEDFKNKTKKDIWENIKKQKEASQVKSIVEDDFEGINLRKLLEAINQRLSALLSKDHTIGHAYFISCRTQKELETIFYQKIIPLLQEYFYGDLSKIEWIIGTDFVKVESVDKNIFIGNNNNIYNLPNKVSFNPLEGEIFLSAIKKIYESNKSL